MWRAFCIALVMVQEKAYSNLNAPLSSVTDDGEDMFTPSNFVSAKDNEEF
jgi:hypothetical protein